MNPYEAIERRAESARSIEEATEVMALLLSEGFAVWKNGRLYSIKQLVAKVHGLRIEVFAREHAPPHFHLKGGGIDATFSLADCSLLKGKVDGREKALIEWWYKRSRPVLIQAWNESRPSDCPVGLVLE